MVGHRELEPETARIVVDLVERPTARRVTHAAGIEPFLEAHWDRIAGAAAARAARTLRQARSS